VEASVAGPQRIKGEVISWGQIGRQGTDSMGYNKEWKAPWEVLDILQLINT
jgi:hypothetical protein